MVCLEKEADRYRSLFHALRFDVPWDRVSGAVREEILREAEAASKLPWPMRPATGFLAFSRSGSRKADEDPYFLRRRKLCWAVLACGLGETRYLDDVVDGVWCICEETSWVISAHNVNPIPGAPSAAEYPLPDPEKPYIDLFSAQTGMILALTAQLAGDSLDQVSPMLRERIRREIRRRILDPFMNTDDFWWMGFRRKDLCNWTPWIVSNVMICALAQPLGPGLLPELLIRACGMLDRWLAVVPPDGGCDEGAGYWNMAGGALLDCLELLESRKNPEYPVLSREGGDRRRFLPELCGLRRGSFPLGRTDPDRGREAGRSFPGCPGAAPAEIPRSRAFGCASFFPAAEGADPSL